MSQAKITTYIFLKRFVVYMNWLYVWLSPSTRSLHRDIVKRWMDVSCHQKASLNFAEVQVLVGTLPINNCVCSVTFKLCTHTRLKINIYNKTPTVRKHQRCNNSRCFQTETCHESSLIAKLQRISKIQDKNTDFVQNRLPLCRKDEFL